METFRKIIDSTFNEFYVFDMETLRFEHVNLRACKNLKYSREELTHLTPLDLIPDFKKEAYEEFIKPLREKKESELVFETMHRRKDGSTYPVKVNLQLMHDESPPVFVALIEDIAEKKQKQNEASLLLSQIQVIAVGTASSIGQDFFNSIVEHLSQALDLRMACLGVLIDEQEEIKTLAIYGNGNILKNVVYPVKGTPCENVVEGKLCLYPNNLQSEFPDDKYLIEMDITSYLGVPLYALNSTQPIGLLSVMDSKPMNKAASTESILRIFATRVEAEIDRQNAERKAEAYLLELERSNTALENFASIASHDLKEPLRKIISFGDLVLRSKEGLGAKEKDYLKRMQDASERMTGLIDDLILYSRVSLKKHPIQKISLTDVVQEVLIDLERVLEQSRGKVAIENLPTLDGNSLEMKQLFQNLIENGLKYQKAGVTPEIKIIGKKRDKDYWEIIVEDNGIGIEEKYLERIFLPFERLHGRNQYEGSGMGLAICRRIVEKHQGEITAESKKNAGTKFIIVLPEKHSESD